MLFPMQMRILCQKQSFIKASTITVFGSKLQKKWEPVLTVLKEHGYPQPITIWNNDYFYEAYTQAMIELGQKSSLFDYLHACYMKK